MKTAEQIADFAAVKRLARQVLENNFITKPPIFASELAAAYGLSVLVAAFKSKYAHIAGFIDFEKKTIVVNQDDSPPRNNFTIAHELGHYLLKHHEAGGYAVLLRDTKAMTKTPFEQEANCFAANVLVPATLLREYLDDYPFATTQQLAKVFGVSTEVIRYRKIYL